MSHLTDAGPWRLAGTLLAFSALAWPSPGWAEEGDAGSASAASSTPSALQVRGNVGLEYQIFPRFEGEINGVRFENPNQALNTLAFKGQLDASYKLDRNWSGAVRAYVRQDAYDDDRNTLRLDEAWVQYGNSKWDLRVGNQLVTWGSVESVSPLDIINPRDYEEDIVEPTKIGLMMARLRLRLQNGDFSMYWLPEYKPSQYAGPQSYYAIGGGLPNDYPPDQWKTNQWAARYFYTGDGFDLGVSYVQGLERNALFTLDPATDTLVGQTYLSRRYGTDMTWVRGDLVLKGEFVWRTSDIENNKGALLYAMGGEYTFSSVWRHADLTFFAEYLGSSDNVRRIELMQNDLFGAARLTFNDLHKQRLQIGGFLDLDSKAKHVFRIEYQFSPTENVDIGGRLTQTRNYYPGPDHVEPNTTAFQFFIRYNM